MVDLAPQPKAGQSLIESCLVIAVMCLVFFGVFQLAQIFAAREFLNYSAARGARARAVGLDRFMVYKVARVGAIPNVGKMTWPELERDEAGWNTQTPRAMWSAWDMALRTQLVSPQYAQAERPRIPFYLGAERRSVLPHILEYEDWESVRVLGPVENVAGRMIYVRTDQEFPLRFPLHRTFYAADTVPLRGEAYIENHYSLYLDRGLY